MGLQDLVASGVFKFNCQVTKSLKTATKLVRVSTTLVGDELVALLAEKFNLGEVHTAEFVLGGVSVWQSINAYLLFFFITIFFFSF